MANQSITVVDLKRVNEADFKHRYVGCIVFTHDKKIMLQQRGADWTRFPAYLSEFGGRIEQNETPMAALIRELNEELGATVNPKYVISLAAVIEQFNNHQELLYLFYWHDKHHSISGCYEGEARYFLNTKEIFSHPKVMASVCFAIRELEKIGLIES